MQRTQTVLVSLLTLILLHPLVHADSPGDTVGTSWDEWESPACAVRRAALDELGGVHFAWTNRVGSSSGERHIYYNFIDERGFMLQPGGIQVNLNAESKYACLDFNSDNVAVISYYNFETGENCLLAVDALRGFGQFTEYDPPNLLFGDDRYFWPRITVDQQGYFHLCAIQHGMEGQPTIILYTRSEDGGSTWTTPVSMDTTAASQSFILASSPIDNSVAIAFIRPDNLFNPVLFDVMYVESGDGVTWDFENGDVNVTNYQASDSLYPGIDLDAVYDNQGNLHLIWNAIREFAGGALETRIYHWSENTGISLVISESEWIDPLGGDLPLAKMSLGVDSDDNLFAVWTRFSPDDIAVNDLPNGELFLSYSIDRGSTWSTPENMTNSPTPGCFQGECDSDHWASIAERVDDFAHIIYINDKYAGPTMPDQPDAKTENPVLYLEVPNPAHTSVEDRQDGVQPESFRLAQNYPNPFNLETKIEVELGNLDFEETPTLKIFNLQGQEVRAYVLENDKAVHEIVWDGHDDSGEEVSSGVYFYQLSGGDFTETKRMTVLK
ncbi:MAG: T9SS type A sorting domain-containing protein [Candidatus Zixiibacteriota bacterium]